MPAAFDLVTLDAADTSLLAAFWSATLGLHPTEIEDDGRWIVLGTHEQPRVLGLQRIVGLQRSESLWHGAEKSRLHLDLSCAPDEFHSEVDRLIGLGALEIRERRSESYGYIATLADPEGNLFDLCAYFHS